MIRPERILFNKVGWMEFYGSRASAEVPSGGGSFNNVEPENAAEGVNFDADPKGVAYGLIHTKTINVQRLGTDGHASFQLGCTVVSVAPHPDGGQVVVAWQAKAEVMRGRRPVPLMPSRPYNYRAPLEQAVLLPISERVFQIPRGQGGMGQSMMVYSVDAGGTLLPWAKAAAEYIVGYQEPNLLRRDHSQTRS